MEEKRSNSASIASSTRTHMPKSQTPNQEPSSRKSFRLKSKPVAALVLVLIVAVASSVYFYTKYKDSQDQLKHPETVAQAQTNDLIVQVARHTELPQGKPTVATVSDVSKLSNQTFFVNAKNGDKVLIYSEAKKAILYRPSEDKVINIAPLNISDTSASTPAAATPTKQ